MFLDFIFRDEVRVGLRRLIHCYETKLDVCLFISDPLSWNYAQCLFIWNLELLVALTVNVHTSTEWRKNCSIKLYFTVHLSGHGVRTDWWVPCSRLMNYQWSISMYWGTYQLTITIKLKGCCSFCSRDTQANRWVACFINMNLQWCCSFSRIWDMCCQMCFFFHYSKLAIMYFIFQVLIHAQNCE